jgi:hypothetical protein
MATTTPSAYIYFIRYFFVDVMVLSGNNGPAVDLLQCTHGILEATPLALPHHQAQRKHYRVALAILRVILSTMQFWWHHAGPGTGSSLLNRSHNVCCTTGGRTLDLLAVHSLRSMAHSETSLGFDYCGCRCTSQIYETSGTTRAIPRHSSPRSML